VKNTQEITVIIIAGREKKHSRIRQQEKAFEAKKERVECEIKKK
jgi:hypothetical protein